MHSTEIAALFVDIGGVLLTNAWDHEARKRVSQQFGLDLDELQDRHYLTFDTYEQGKLTLDEYLTRVVFHKPRSFSRDVFRAAMFAQSRPYPDMLQLLRDLRARYGPKVVAVSNEGRELTAYRVQTFGLVHVIDFFVSSCFVHLRKPDPDIYRMALDVAQTPLEQVLYIEDRDVFVDAARGIGIRSILHISHQSTKDALAGVGLGLP